MIPLRRLGSCSIPYTQAGELYRDQDGHLALPRARGLSLQAFPRRNTSTYSRWRAFDDERVQSTLVVAS